MNEIDAMAAIFPVLQPEPKQDEKGNWIVYLPGKASPVTLTPEDYQRWREAQQEAKR